MVMRAMPSVAVWYLTSTSGGSSLISRHVGRSELISSNPSLRTQGGFRDPSTAWRGADGVWRQLAACTGGACFNIAEAVGPLAHGL